MQYNNIKSIIMLAVATTAMTACSNNIADDFATDNNHPAARRAITFTVENELTTSGFTRADITADGKKMTDLYVLDYIDGQLAQQIHQTSEETDFGQPSIALDYGEHHLYFVCSRGKQPVLDTDEHTISWGTPSDTFWSDLTLTVTSASAATQNVTLSRVATKLCITVNDEIPIGLAAITITPATWYYGIDYLTGQPADTHTSQPFTINIPTSYVGRTNTLLTIFGMSDTEEWTTDVIVRAQNTDNDQIGQATITNVPLKANRATNYNGNLFVSGASLAFTLTDQWENAANGTW